MNIVVQLVLGLTGCQFPVELRHQKTPLLFASSSLASTLQVGGSNSSSKIFVSDVVTLVSSCRSTPVETHSIEGSTQNYVELFDFNTLRPLRTNEVVVEGQKLLLFTTNILSEALEERLLQQSSLSGGGETGNSQYIYTEDEERWQNLKQAIMALDEPIKLHQQVMEKEKEICVKKLKTTASQLTLAKEGMEGAIERIKNIKVFYSPETPVYDLIDVSNFDIGIKKGEAKLQEASNALEKAEAMYPSIIQSIKSELENSNNLKTTPTWNNFLTSSNPNENNTNNSIPIITTLMHEVGRKVHVVRQIVKDITIITKLLQNSRHFADAVITHVVHRHQKLTLLPEGMEAAQHVVHRRIILRRAIRRLLISLESAHHETEGVIRQFAEKWRRLLPDEVYKAVAAPLPPLYPTEDKIAQNMDRLFVNVNEDETEELLVKIGAITSPEVQKRSEVENKLSEMEKELRQCKAELEEETRKRSELEKALKELQEGTKSSSSNV